MAAPTPDPSHVDCVVCNASQSSSLAGWALGISILVLAVQVLTFVFANYRNRRRDQSAKVDEAWFKAIVLDDCLPELQKFSAVQQTKFVELASGTNQTVAQHVQFMRQFSQETESLSRKIAMTECMSQKAMQAVLLEIELLSDVVATNASKVLDASNATHVREEALAATKAQFDLRTANCLLIWKNLHSSLQHGRDPEKCEINVGKGTPDAGR